MKQYSNYGQAQAMTSRKSLPAGGYVIGIISATEKLSKSNKPMLELQIDIAEGNERGFFLEQSRVNGGKQWPGGGIYRIMLPENENAAADDQSLRRLKGLMKAIEESNPGYVWNWDERSLKGKKVGSLWRKEEFITSEGNSAWSTKCCVILSADKIRSGDFSLPKDKPLQEARQDLNAGFTPVDPGIVEDPDLPF